MTTSRNCVLLLFVMQMVYVAWSQEVVKRVPSGFIGMRGKKLDSEELERFYKRKPQFFVGVKGKKSYDTLDDVDPFYYKRAPLGFVGMRGKKDVDLQNDAYDFYPRAVGSLIGKIDYAANEDVNSGNDFLQNEITKYLNMLNAQILNLQNDDGSSPLNEIQSYEYGANEVDKRAANRHQFFGVRGKKSIQNKRPYDLTFRGKFIGVRGKKDGKNDGAQEMNFLLDQAMPKRKSQMGFFGMRGKKWTDESTANTETPI